MLGLLSFSIALVDGLLALGVFVMHGRDYPGLPRGLADWVDSFTSDGRWYSFESGLGIGGGLVMLARYGRARRSGVAVVEPGAPEW